jgi:ubiquitin C-terminal hydrolase
MYHGTGGGHYTSYILSDPTNSNGSGAKKQDLWLKCNDSGISRIDKADIISKDAYILFYKRRELTTSNIINLTAPAF